MLTAEQIPQYWEVIKYAVVNVEIVEEQYREKYLNNLLYQLLAGKVQCFVRLGEGRQLEMVGLTSIQVDHIRDDRTLFCYALYSFKKVPGETWASDFVELVQWAKASKCKSITLWSNNEKAINLCKMLGIKKRLEMFILDIPGGA